MTEEEIRARLAEVKAEIAPHDIWVAVHASQLTCYLTEGGGSYRTDRWSLYGDGPTIGEAINDALRQFAERQERMAREVTERMALAIIRISHAFGSCARSQLYHDFGPHDVARLADAAAALASEMAAGGPFTVIDDAKTSNEGIAA